MSRPLLDRLVEFWRRQGLRPSPGLADAEVGRLESEKGITLPPVLRALHQRFLIPDNFTDQNVFQLLPLSGMRSMEEEARGMNPVPETLPPNSESWFTFVDYMVWSWMYVVQLHPAVAGWGGVARWNGGRRDLVAPDVETFFEVLMRDDRRLYGPDAPVRPPGVPIDRTLAPGCAVAPMAEWPATGEGLRYVAQDGSVSPSAGHNGVGLVLGAGTSVDARAVFQFGERAGGTVTAVYALPDGHVVVVARGQAYRAEAGELASVEVLPIATPVVWAHPHAERGLLLLGDWLGITAVGDGGVAWQTRRFAMDGFDVTAVGSDHVEGHVDVYAGDRRPFRVLLADGTVDGGVTVPGE